MRCAFTPDIASRIDAEFAGIQMDYEMEDISIQEAHDLLLNLLKSYSEIENKNDLLVATVTEVATRYGFLGGDARLFPLDVNIIRNIINDGYYTEAKDIENGKDIIEELEVATRRLDAKTDFLNITYGHATQARAYAELQMAVDLVDSIVVDRKNGEVIDTKLKLNRKIRAHQESLFSTIIDAIQDHYSRIPDTLVDLSFLEGATLYNSSTRDFNSELYTKVRNLAERIGLHYTQATKELWNRFHDNVQRMFLDRTNPINLKKLAAIAAIQFLHHYDSYLNARYGKALSIKEFGRFSAKDKYGIADKGESNITTHRDTEDIDVGKEIPNIVNELITTTPLYVNKVKTDSYLKVSDLSNVIGTIKDFEFKLGNRNLLFTAKDSKGNRNGYLSLVKSLSESTIRTLTLDSNGHVLETPMTLSRLANMVRLNPLKYLSALFEILSNEDSLKYINSNSPLVSLTIAPITDLVYSLYEGIFNPNNGSNSLNSISAINRHDNYYTWVTQACDSIFKVKYLQYYKNMLGITTVRDMSDSGLDSYVRSIKHSIKVARPARLNNQFDKRCVNKFTVNKDGNGNFAGITMEVSFGGKRVVLNVPRDGANVTIKTPAGTDFIIDPNKDPNFVSEALVWINNALNLNIDRHLLETIAGDRKKVASTLRNLLEMASRTTMLLYVSTDIISKAKPGEGDSTERRKFLQAKIKEVLGEDTKQNLDRQLHELDVIHANDLPMIEAMANAYAIEDGMYSSSQVKNGEGSSQSQYTLSRLLGSLTTLIEYDCRRHDAAMRDSLFATIPGLFKGVYTAREYYDGQTSKDHTKFNVSEFIQALLLYDYVGGLASNPDLKGVVGDGVVAFIPSVNSDKNTIGRILIDTNIRVDVTEKGQIIPKRIRDLNSQLYEELIERELGGIYDKTYKSIIEDFAKLYPDFTYTDYLDGFSRFNEECARKGIEPVTKLKQDLLVYNLEHRNAPIHLIDQIHYLVGSCVLYDPKTGLPQLDEKGEPKKGKSLAPNKTLLSYLYRYKAGPFEHPSRGWTEYTSEAEELSDLAEYLAKLDAYSVLKDPKNGFVDLKTFWDIKRAEITKSLLDSGFKLDLINPNPDSDTYSLRELNYLSKEYFVGDKAKWIDLNTGNIIIATFNGLKIVSKEDIRDLDSKYKESLIQFLNTHGMAKKALKLVKGSILDDASNFGYLSAMGAGQLELNPLIDSYNYLNYLFSLEFMISTVGSCIAHPGKGNIDTVLEEEAARYQAQHKRNVSYTAAMLEFQLGMLNGIPSQYNIAIVEDIKDVQYNVLGSIDNGIKPYDGATYVNPFVVHWENASLGGAKAGITKKLFVHYYDARTGTGGIIKTCGFGLTNDWINNSRMMLAMMKLMTGRNWMVEGSNQLFYIDITKDYNGNTINYGKLDDNGAYSNYFKGTDGNYYQISRIEAITENGNPTNKYRVYGRQLEVAVKDGKLGGLVVTDSTPEINISHALDLTKAYVPSTNSETALFTLNNEQGSQAEQVNGDTAPDSELYKVDSVEVNSNYDLWNLFGGRFSLERQGNKLVPSELSILNVVKASNLIGTVRNGATSIETLDDLYLPLKHSDVHYMPTAGAVKQGTANINGKNIYGDMNAQLNSMVINMNLAGIQLDKEHHADGTELSLMTLVINACSHLGYTADDAMHMYNALSTLTESATAELANPFKEYFANKDDADFNIKFREAVINSVVRSLSREKVDESSLLFSMAAELMEKAKEGQTLKWDTDIKGNLPIDNSAIQALFLSKINVFLTSAGIKAKIPGILSVLTPSHEIFKIYDGLKVEEIENNIEKILYEDKLRKMQEEIEADPDRAVVYTEVTSRSNDRLQLIRHARTSKQKFKLALQFYGITEADLEDYKTATLEDYVANHLSKGVLKRGDSKTSAGVYRELGIHSRDIAKFKDLFNESTGLTVDAFVHQLWLNLPNPELWDTEAIKGALLDIISSAENMESLRNYSLNSLVNFKELELVYYEEPDVFSTQTNLHNLHIGRTYKVVYRATNGVSRLESGLQQEEYVNIDTPVKRALYRDLIRNGKIYSMVEWIMPVEKINPLGGRNLGSYDVHFYGTNGEAYTLYDFDSTKALFDLKDVVDKINKLRDKIRNGEIDINTYRQEEIKLDSKLLVYAKQYELLFKDPKLVTVKNIDRVLKNLRLQVRKDNAAISKTGDKYFKRDFVLIDNQRVLIDYSQPIEIIPYELALPKIKIKEFGLETYDSLNEIKKDPQFFTRRSFEHYTSTIADEKTFDVELKRIGGDHLYILEASRLADLGNLEEVPILKFNENGKISRIDEEGNFVHQLASENDRIFRDANGTEIIVTESPTFYIRHENYSILRLSNKFMDKNNDGFLTYINRIRRCTKNNIAAGVYYKYIYDHGYVPGDENGPGHFNWDLAFQANDTLRAPVDLENIEAHPAFTITAEIGKVIHASFLKSLEIVGSRTPSQSMQSFMPMRIAAFDNPNRNTAFVSTALIWLQGSDY